MAWEIHTKDQTQVPSVRELIAFLRFQADVMPETSSTHSHKTKQEHPQWNQDSQPNKYRAEVHSTTTTPTPQSTYGPRTPFRYECRLCPGNKHPLFQCPAFNEMSIKLRGGPFTYVIIAWPLGIRRQTVGVVLVVGAVVVGITRLSIGNRQQLNQSDLISLNLNLL